ncbi:MAG TPA: TetR/AcrR family transcriptional regulator [Rhizomicrobium sp.]|jgi:AcrR family transcriptional regulator
MPYPAGHRAALREKIVDSARRLFNKRGFDNVSIAQIMAGAGLTHGGFYSYFKSKSDLYTEVMACFFTDPGWKHRWDGVDIDPTGELGPQIVRAYLSRGHFEDVENSCPLVALPSDAARNGVAARRAFEGVFAAMVEMLAHGARGKRRRANAQAIAALCVGGMVVARAMANPKQADELRDACRAVALALGGWDQKIRTR